MAWASAPATRSLEAGGDGGEDAARLLSASTSASTRAQIVHGLAPGSRRPPASSSSRTRRWSAPTPSRTRPPASTRTACSRPATPTRSCAPGRGRRREQRSSWASCRAGVSSACRNSASPRFEAEVNAAFARFKDLADRKAEIFDETSSRWSATRASPASRSTTAWRWAAGTSPDWRSGFAGVCQFCSWRDAGAPCQQRRQRPVDASLKAIESKVSGLGAELLLYLKANAISGSTESQGERSPCGCRRCVVNGGADPDIVAACRRRPTWRRWNKLRSQSDSVSLPRAENL